MMNKAIQTEEQFNEVFSPTADKHSHAHLKQVFAVIDGKIYNRKTQRFIGSVDDNGYIRVGYAGKAFPAHRLVWFLAYGIWPKETLDHINGNKADNRIENLRECSRSENTNFYIKKQRTLAGVLGVTKNFDKKKKRQWVVQIGGGRKTKYIGSFDCWGQAVLARKAAEKQLFI